MKLSSPLRTTVLHGSEALAEADRLMVVCNSCRYCEGLCAVFPAMELRRTFADGDLNYLANLCHGCGACYDDCQFSPPHEFNVNVPRALAVVRNESYEAHAWPSAAAGIFARNGVAVTLVATLTAALMLGGWLTARGPVFLWSRHVGAGAFYRLISHRDLVLLFGGIFLYAVTAMTVGAARFGLSFRDGSAEPGPGASAWQALKDAASLRYLDGGGGGCRSEDQRGRDTRRVYHHLTFYGFILCFVSTCVATAYHYFLAREAPYAWYDLPVVLGTVGGIGIVVGPVGLLLAKRRRPRDLLDERRAGMDRAFVILLLLTGVTGLALLGLRTTPLLSIALAAHLGVVAALFATMPYGKFVHGLYRFLALMHYAREVGRGGIEGET